LQVDNIDALLDLFSQQITLIIHSGIESRGIANLYPRIVMSEKYVEHSRQESVNA
jgi:hypothetical protein